MSELYEHLKRLEEKEQRHRKDGAPLLVPVSHPSKAVHRKRSRLKMCGIPATLVLLGVLGIWVVTTVITAPQDNRTAGLTRLFLSKEPVQPDPAPPMGIPAQKSPALVEENESVTPTPAGLDGGIAHPQREIGAEAGQIIGMPTEMATSDGAPETTTGDNSTSSVLSKEREASKPAEDLARKPETKAQAIEIPSAKPTERPPTRPNSKPQKSVTEKKPSMEWPRQVLVIAEEARRGGDLAEAERGYREYLATDEDPWVMNNLGGILMKQNRWVEAEEILGRAYEKRQAPEIAANLCLCLWHRGKRDAACAVASSIRDVPEASHGLAILGSLLRECSSSP